jgi:hypothetical protein
MKTKYITKIMLLALIVSIFSCESDEEAEILQNDDQAGVLINISNSSGAVLGSPESGVPIEDASVTLTEVMLDFNMSYVSGSMDGVSKFEVVKFYNGDVNQGIPETIVAESTSLPFSFSLNTIDEFLVGTGVTEDELRIGDTFTFRVKIYQTDGDVYYYNNPMGRFSLTVNCASDLTGTYIMTNSVCASSVSVQISQNSDGSWLLSTADGGLLQFCSTNSSLVNVGSISIGCGGVVSQAVPPAYCDGYGIGCIVGGTWDQNAGILVLDNTNGFFTWAPAEYTSTYVRQ